MSKIVLNDVTNLNALSVINDNFDKLEQELQNKVLYRDNPEGEPNGLEGDLDANGNSLYNVQDLTITGSFSVNGKDIETVIDDAVQGIEDNATAAENAATAAGISAASANTSATAAAASASTASTKASEASTSASNAASSATAAASSSSTATTQAGIATTKASEASASASAAATSAPSAAASKDTAIAQAAIATTQATNAASSASSASTSATSAANSAAAAATALDSFDDRYLGSKSSDPTLDNDGNALLTGALYYNTTSQTMKVYDGANWITATAAGTTAMNVYKYVATASQTTFSGAAAVGGTMSYTSGNIIVFVNGVSLDSTDYTATNGTSVVLGVAAALNDEVVVVAFKSFTVADTYTQSAADAEFLRKAGEDGVTVTSGNVGIGTSSPDAFGRGYTKMLTVGGSGQAAFQVNSATGSGAYLDMGVNGVRYFGFVVDSSGAQINTYNASPILFSTNSTERARIDSSGNLLVGTTNSNFGKVTCEGAGTGNCFYARYSGSGGASVGYYSQYYGTTGTAYHAYFVYNGSNVGSIQSNSTTTSFLTSSDYRLKENIAPMAGALGIVARLKPCTYNWKVDGSDGQGFIAHELQEVVPECVVGEKDAVDADGNPSYQGIDTSFLVATLTAAIQEQQAIIEQLRADVETLKGQA